MDNSIKGTQTSDQQRANTNVMRLFFGSLKAALNQDESIIPALAERFNDADTLIDLMREYEHTVLEVQTFKDRYFTKCAFYTTDEDYQVWWIRTVADSGQMMVYAIDQTQQTLDTLDRDHRWRAGRKNDLANAFRDPATGHRAQYPFEFINC